MALVLRARGLHTFKNSLSEIPTEGALIQADNVVIDRDGVIGPRRGFKAYGDEMPLGGDRASQLLVYKNRILRHFRDVLQFDDGNGTFSDFSGMFEQVEEGLRIKGIEANSNFYFTTSEGIKKISAPSASSFSTAAGYIKQSGVAKGLDVNALVDYTTPGFLEALSKVAYRIVWGIRDENNNLILGGVSQRTVITNYSENDSAVVQITSTIPQDVNTTDFFYQIYRTAISTAASLSVIDDVDPGDEMNLVFEQNLTSTDLSNGFISVQDITPEDFRSGGTLLYTNPVSGEGILQSNDRPPLSKDLTLFNGSVFYANTETPHRLNINLLGLSDFVSGTSKLIISNGLITNEYTFVGENEISDVTVLAVASFDDQDFFLLNGPSNERKYFIWYDQTGTSLTPTDPETSGRIGIRVDVSTVTLASEVASETVDALNDKAGFDFLAEIDSIDDEKVIITNLNNGDSDDIADSTDRPTGFTFNTSQQGDGEDIGSLEVLLSGLSSPSQQVDDSSRSLVRIINRNSSEQIYAFYLSGPDDVPGAMLFEKRSLTDGKFYVAVNESDLSDQFNPNLPVTISITSITTGLTPTITTSTAHNLSPGDTVVIYGTDSTPSIDGVYTVETTPLTTTFTINVNSAVTIAGTTGTVFEGTVFSDNEVKPNRLYFSKFQQPESVPLVNFIDVGRKDEKIQRVLALRDSLFILKENSIHRLSGDIAPNFSVSLLDSSSNVPAPDTAVILNNLIYTVTSQDVITVSETGVQIVSRAIEDQITDVTSLTKFSTASFGVAYEKDRAYLLFVVSEENDLVATQCFRYNVFTNSWTRWPISKSSGIVNPLNDKLYLGAGDENFIEIERKDLDRRDHTDRESSLEIPANSVNGVVITLSSVSGIEIGDTVVQIQYLTIGKFNRLLKKLDMDPSLADNDYFSTLKISPGESLSNSMSNLVSKLNNDANTTLTYVFSGSLDFETIQTEFNDIIDNLNSASESGTFYKNYQYSTGTFEFEATNITVDINQNTITLLYELPLLQGPITLFKGIPSTIIWAPQHFGDPSVLKQIKEGTLIFEDNVFTTAEISYSTDLSPSFKEITFRGKGLGDWGFFSWGEQNWGGEGNQVPIRTLIPQQKQRCRFINPKFFHTNAREKYQIFGISLDPRPLSTRGYK